MSKVVSREANPSKKPKRKNGEGSIYWDKHLGKYVAAVVDINGKRQRARFDSEDDAQAWRNSQKEARQKGEGTFVRNPKSSLAEYLTDWLKAKDDLSPNGYRNYEQTIRNRINPHIGHLKLSNLNAKILENFFKQLIVEHEYKAGTIRGVIRTLNTAFNDGVRWGDLPFNPLKKAKLPTLQSTPSPQIPSEDAAKLRIEAAKHPFDHARLEIGIAIGLRPGEVAGLKWKDFDEQKRTLRIVRQIQRVKGKGLIECPPKTLRKKPIELIDEEVAALVALRKYQMRKQGKLISGDDYIFPNSVGKAMDSTGDRKWFRNLCARAGVERYQRYQMRKTAFTELSHVADLGTVKAYSGHTQIATLINHYIDPSDAAIRGALEKRKENRQQGSNAV